MIEFSFHYAYLPSALAFLSGVSLSSSLWKYSQDEEGFTKVALLWLGIALATIAIVLPKLGA